MSIVNTDGPGFWFPSLLAGGATQLQLSGTAGGITAATLITLDATGEKGAYLGTVHWAGRPGSSKTMGSSSKIHVRTGTVTFADAGTTLRVGIQDVTTAGLPVQPDGSFDVYKDVVPGAGELSSSSDNTSVSFTLSTSGSKSIAEGDLIAIVFDMTARGGSDSVILTQLAGVAYAPLPCVQNNLTGTWSYNTSSGASLPIVLLEADDGTKGILRGGIHISSASSFTFNSSSSPKEYGLIFRVPWACTVDAFITAMGNNNNANADADIVLYSDPLGTPAAVFTYTVNAESGSNLTDERWRHIQLPSTYVLKPDTDYCIAVKAIGSSNVELGYVTLRDATDRSVMGLANCRRGSRSTGAFSETTTEIPLIAVGICGVDSGQPSPSYLAGVM